jgi:hypothetical protein
MLTASFSKHNGTKLFSELQFKQISGN